MGGAVDEIELRVAALELVIIELGAWLDPRALEDAGRSIAAGVGRGDADEDAIRQGAVHLLEDARLRFALPARRGTGKRQVPD